MLKQNCLIELGENYLIKHDFYPRLLNSSLRNDEYVLNLLKESQFCLSSKKVYIVIEGEKINIREITLPKLRSCELYKLIIDELSNSYNNSDKIFFNYSILKDNGINLDLAIFSSNEGRFKKIEKYILKNSTIEAVYLIQFCFLGYFNEAITHRNFFFVFIYKDKLYLLLCLNKKLIYNDVVQWNDENKLNKTIFEFMEGCRINNGIVTKNIYTANIGTEINCNEYVEGCYISNLGLVYEDELIKYIRKSKCKRPNRR
ncbi:hypothetical protein [Candidatus Clostridium stratigraminis]|uniref:Uncharacterized protein n=1 Tax=Candidatus Clostridium stratigraminis TaxID=3381661 RepID=A0ABW8T2F4_9CLOT